MNTKQSNHTIPILHRLITGEYGENYWFNGSARYVMECLGEEQYDYPFFAGLTGDVIAQFYPTDGRYRGDGVLVGYEDHGKTLLFITGNDAEPKRLTFEEAITPTDDDADDGWIFIGDKTTQANIADVYRYVIRNLPALFESNVYEYIFGARAFRAWAEAIEGGAFDNVKSDEFDAWGMHTAYVCALSTNATCSWRFFDKVMAACPDMTFLEDVKAQYQRMAALWNNDKGTDLEALGGGFNVTLEALQDKGKRTKIAAKIRAFAVCADEVVSMISENTQ